MWISMKKGYTVYKQYSGINLIQNGFNSYSTKGNTGKNSLTSRGILV